MEGEIKFVDGAIGQWVNELKKQHLLNSTTIIITAKHGNRRSIPIGSFPSRPQRHEWHSAVGATRAAFLPDSEINQIGATEDDISLLWLKPGASTLARRLLEANANAAGIGQIFYGPRSRQSMASRVYRPLAAIRAPGHHRSAERGCDLHGKPEEAGEHGGFAQDDTNVILLVSNPSLKPRTVTSFVETAQVAPTVLKILGLDPMIWTRSQRRHRGVARASLRRVNVAKPSPQRQPMRRTSMCQS